jgi:hypothetical protein
LTIVDKHFATQSGAGALPEDGKASAPRTFGLREN